MFREKRKLIRQKIREKTFILGLSSVAVLWVLADQFLSFPDRHTTIGQVLRQIDERKSVKDRFEELKELGGFNLRTTLHRLEKKGLINKKKGVSELTPTGKALIKKIEEEIQSRNKWDGKWRLVTFDIPEKIKNDREWLRFTLKKHYFNSLQKSVFVGKYALPESVYKELHERKITQHVRLLTVGEIDEEEFLLS